jgi:putative ABC transport system permease protein
MALGAQRIDVAVNMILEVLKVTLTGIVIGLFAALGLTRLMGSLLYDVKPNDPLIFGAVAAALAATSLLACCRPILRAATVDPVVALRYE